MTDIAFLNYSLTHELQSTLEASAIQWPAVTNHISCMAHVIQLGLGAFMSSLGFKGSTKFSEAHDRNQQFGENETVDIGKSQRLRKEGKVWIDKVWRMKPVLAKIFDNVHISQYFESAEADLHIAENACCIDYANTSSSKRVHWLSESQRPHRGTSDHGCEETSELDRGVARERLAIKWIHTQVVRKPKIQCLLATLHHSRWMDHSEVCHGSVDAIPMMYPVDSEGAYSHIASRYLSVQSYDSSHGWRDVSIGYQKCSMEESLLLRREVSLT